MDYVSNRPVARKFKRAVLFDRTMDLFLWYRKHYTVLYDAHSWWLVNIDFKNTFICMSLQTLLFMQTILHCKLGPAYKDLLMLSLTLPGTLSMVVIWLFVDLPLWLLPGVIWLHHDPQMIVVSWCVCKAPDCFGWRPNFLILSLFRLLHAG